MEINSGAFFSRKIILSFLPNPFAAWKVENPENLGLNRTEGLTLGLT